MARKGSKKGRSVEHENFIASLYDGKRSASSGAADTDEGDVKTDLDLFECKTTGTADKPAKSTLVTRMEKLADEAYSVGRAPVLALRFYMPESKLANNRGYVDLSVRLSANDALLCELT